MTKRTLDDAIGELASAASATHRQTSATEEAAELRARQEARMVEQIGAVKDVFKSKFEAIKAALATKNIEASVFDLSPIVYKFIDGLVVPQQNYRGTHVISMIFPTGKFEKDQYGVGTVPARAVIRVLRINDVPVVALCAAASESGDLYKFISLPAAAVRDGSEDLDMALMRVLDEIKPRDQGA